MDQRTADRIAELLIAGAGTVGPQAAAVHLLVFTEVHARQEVADLIETDGITAFVVPEGWRSLPSMQFSPPLPPSATRLLRLGCGLVCGTPVNLQETTQGLGTAHARRVAEAVLIAAGAFQFFDLTETETMRDLRSVQASFRAPSQ